MNCAAVDLGTNTLRLLVGERDSGARLLKRNFYLFLGSEVREGAISRSGLAKLETALNEIKEIIADYNVTETTAVATAFARKLSDTSPVDDVFLRTIGTRLHVITPETEGKIVLEAIRNQFSCSEFCVLDMGGGSTEFICLDHGTESVVSMDFGSLVLTERFLTKAVPDVDQKNNLCAFVAEQAESLRAITRHGRIFGVGGTITTIAFLLSGSKTYDPDRINGYEVSIRDLEKFYHSIEYMEPESIKERFPVEEGRERVLIAGCLALLVIMHSLCAESVTASDASLIEGIIPFSRKNAFST